MTSTPPPNDVSSRRARLQQLVALLADDFIKIDDAHFDKAEPGDPLEKIRAHNAMTLLTEMLKCCTLLAGGLVVDPVNVPRIEAGIQAIGESPMLGHILSCPGHHEAHHEHPDHGDTDQAPGASSHVPQQTT
ncbi:hypothetical protein [Streptomyces noursei]